MKTLYLVRHAKSDWNHDGLADIDRPLNARGYRDANTMSRLLKEKKIVPSLIISSPAIRAISTALIFSRNLGYNTSNLLIKPDLYDSTLKQYLNVIKQVDNHYQSIMLFGHNPVISNVVNSFECAINDTMSTCAIAGIQADDCNNWQLFADTLHHKLILYDFPKNNM